MDNIITNDISQKKKIETLKHFRYVNERNELTQKLLKILNIDENNKTFCSFMLDNDKEKQQKILDLEPDVKKYFSTAHWSYYHKNSKAAERPYLSLAKSILKDMKIKVNKIRASIKYNNKFTTCTTYEVIYH